MPVAEEVEKVWTEFWEPILLINTDDKEYVDMDQLKRELFDYHTVMEKITQVYNDHCKEHYANL